MRVQVRGKIYLEGSPHVQVMRRRKCVGLYYTSPRFSMRRKDEVESFLYIINILNDKCYEYTTCISRKNEDGVH